MKLAIILLAVVIATAGLYFNQRHRDTTMAQVNIEWVGDPDDMAVGDSLLACALGTSQSGKTYILEPALVMRLEPDTTFTIQKADSALKLCKNSLLVAGHVINTRRSPPVEWGVHKGAKIKKGDLKRSMGMRS